MLTPECFIPAFVIQSNNTFKSWMLLTVTQSNLVSLHKNKIVLFAQMHNNDEEFLQRAEKTGDMRRAEQRDFVL